MLHATAYRIAPLHATIGGNSGDSCLPHLFVAARVWKRPGLHSMAFLAQINCNQPRPPAQNNCKWACIRRSGLAFHFDGLTLFAISRLACFASLDSRRLSWRVSKKVSRSLWYRNHVSWQWLVWAYPCGTDHSCI